jgi:hypothetical protein
MQDAVSSESIIVAAINMRVPAAVGAINNNTKNTAKADWDNEVYWITASAQVVAAHKEGKQREEKRSRSHDHEAP